MKRVAFFVATAFTSLTAISQDLPTAGQVISGSASISQTGQNQTITQTTDKAIINWGSFSIGSSSSVNFVQPGSNSVVLNRVTGGDPSSILGSLSANGKVFLVNPNGIFFGFGSSVDTAGLVATTMSISDSDFLSNHYSFERNSAASIENAGVITIRGGGYALLAADKVSNSATGQINATKGNVGLISADRVTIETQSDGLVGFSVEGSALRQIASVENAGLITADGGKIVMSARSTNELTGMVVNNTGVLRAQSIDERDGAVILSASSGVTKSTGSINTSGKRGGTIQVTNDQGVAAVSGQLAATGTTGAGGSIIVAGKQTGVFADSTLDVTGATGGQVRVGGDFHGATTAGQVSDNTYVAGSANLLANGLAGNGGSVVVWANDATRFDGFISAKGTGTGAGGNAEVSGKQNLVFNGFADLTALSQQYGTLLLDPSTITITAGAAASGSLDTEFGNAPANQILVATADNGGNTISRGTLQAAVAGADVVLEATGLITLADLGGGTLSMAQTSSGSLRLTSTTTGGVTFANKADTISTQGANITVESLGTGVIDIGNLSSGSGSISLTANSNSANAITTGNLSTTATGSVTYNTFGGIAQIANTKITADSVVISKASNVALTQANLVNKLSATNISGTSFNFKSMNDLTVNQLAATNASSSVVVESDKKITLANLGGTTRAVAGALRLTSDTSGGVEFANTADTIASGGSLTIEALGTAGGAGIINVGNLSASNGAAISLKSNSNNVQAITAGNLNTTGTVFYNTAGGIWQIPVSHITANSVVVTNANKVDLGQDNQVNQFAANVTGTASSPNGVDFRSVNDLVVNTVSVSGAANADIKIVSTGNMTVTGAVTALANNGAANATSPATVALTSSGNMTINNNVLAQGGGSFGVEAAKVSLISTNASITQSATNNNLIKAYDTAVQQADSTQLAHSATVLIQADNGSVSTKQVLAESTGGRSQVNINAKGSMTATGTITSKGASQPGVNINTQFNGGNGNIDTSAAVIKTEQTAERVIPSTGVNNPITYADINKQVSNVAGASDVGGVSVAGNTMNLGAMSMVSTAASGQALYGISTNSNGNTTFNQAVSTNSAVGITISTPNDTIIKTAGSGSLNANSLGIKGDRDKAVFSLATNISTLTALGGKAVDIDNSSHGSGVLTISALGQIADAYTEQNTGTQIAATNKPVGAVRIKSQNIKLLSMDNRSTNTYAFDGSSNVVAQNSGGSARQDLIFIANNLDFVQGTISTGAKTYVNLRPFTDTRNIQLAYNAPSVADVNTTYYVSNLAKSGLLDQFNPSSTILFGGSGYNGNISVGYATDTSAQQISLGDMTLYFETLGRFYNNYAFNPDSPATWNNSSNLSAPYSPSPAFICGIASLPCLTKMTTTNSKIYIKDSLQQGNAASPTRNIVLNGVNTTSVGGTVPPSSSQTGSGTGGGNSNNNGGNNGGGSSSNDNDSGPGGTNAPEPNNGGGNETANPPGSGTTQAANNPGQVTGNPGGNNGTPSDPSTPGTQAGNPNDTLGTPADGLAGGGQFSGNDPGYSNPIQNGGQTSNPPSNNSNPTGGGTLTDGSTPGSTPPSNQNGNNPVADNTNNNNGFTGGGNNGNNNSNPVNNNTGGGTLSDGTNPANNNPGNTQTADNGNNGFNGGGTNSNNNNSNNSGTNNTGGATLSDGTLPGGNQSGNNSNGNTQVADNTNNNGFTGGGNNNSNSSGSSGNTSGGATLSDGSNTGTGGNTQTANNGTGSSGANNNSNNGSSNAGNSNSSGSTTPGNNQTASNQNNNGFSGGGSSSNGSGTNNSNFGDNAGGATFSDGSGVTNTSGGTQFAGNSQTGGSASNNGGSTNTSGTSSAGTTTNTSGSSSNSGSGSSAANTQTSNNNQNNSNGFSGGASSGSNLANNNFGDSAGGGTFSDGSAAGGGSTQFAGNNQSGGGSSSSSAGSSSSGSSTSGSGTVAGSNGFNGGGSSTASNTSSAGSNSANSSSGNANGFSGGASGTNGGSSNVANNSFGDSSGGASFSDGSSANGSGSTQFASNNKGSSNGQDGNSNSSSSSSTNSNSGSANNSAGTVDQNTSADADNPFAGGAGGGSTSDAKLVAQNDANQAESYPPCEDESQSVKTVSKAGQPNGDMIQMKATGMRLRQNTGTVSEQRASCKASTKVQ
ncbi:hypothetical protein ZMTM_10750 [Methyloradius palustris]|uniref:Filamentous haemagglutinin FhaB/tRNA nuclease CdiA-like TPS domain-containing protein n=1 Tax=Methyloradius palustris TaxID=2778876 RepID=A0A8D5G7V9_9PROT|nr:hypothetical protein ZMTM_10750 [Methyloradius palustris]